MRITLFALAALSTSFVTASHSSHDFSLLARQNRHARSTALVPRDLHKRCAGRNNRFVIETKTTKKKKTHSSTAAPEATEAKHSSSSKDKDNDDDSSSSNSGVYSGSSGSCGDSGATYDVTATSGPMGGIDFFNCGINSGGWNPPKMTMNDLHYVSLDDAISAGGSPFKACSEYVHLFNQYGNQYGIPPMMMASFALQESSCNPSTTGGGGEAGLMQLTHDKCGGAPGGNCYDPDYNIKTATKFFAGLVADHNGEILAPIGKYNGWFEGMTYDDATAARWGPCCKCQNNLDYLHQFLNGWMQNKNAYDSGSRLGKYFNLDVC